MAYTPFKMKGHTLPGIKQKESPAKHDRKQGHSHSTHDTKSGGKINLATYKDGTQRDVTHLTAKSPAKQKYDIHGTDERAYKVNQEKYDKWAKGKGAPDVRYLGTKENKKHLEAYLSWKKSGGKEGKAVKGASPSKWMQFIPMALSAVSSLAKKNKEE